MMLGVSPGRLGRVGGGLAVRNVSAPIPDPAIARMPVSNAYYLKGDGTTTGSVTTLLQQNANVATIGTSVVSDAVANSVTTFGWETSGPITGKGALIWFMGASAIPDTIMQSMVIERSADSVAADWLDGTWTAVPFSPVKPSGESNTASMLTRGQVARVPTGTKQRIRVKFTKDNNTTARTIRAALFQRPAEGVPDDLVVLAGPSLMSPHMVTDMRTSLRAIDTNYDPIVVNMGRAGAVAADVVTETVVGGLNAYPEAGTMVLDIGGNDITSNRPYTEAQQHLPNALASVKATLAGYPACKLYLQSITWRNYPTAPAVNDLLNPENGSKPYNDAQIYPWMRAEGGHVWDAALGIPWLDLYSALMYAGQTVMNSDGIHLLTAGNTIYRAEGFVPAYLHRKQKAWTRAGTVERTIAAAETAGTITAANKARLQACIDQWPPVQNGSQTTARNGLQTRLAAITVSG